MMTIDIERVTLLLEQTRMFHEMPPSELRQLASAMRPHLAPEGALLFSEGEPGDFLFIVAEGEVEIIKGLGTPAETVLARRGPGELIGEMSLFALNGERTASVRTTRPSLMMELSRAEFDQLLERHPKLTNEIVRVLGERLNSHENQAIRELTEINLQLRIAYEDLKAAQAELVEKERLERELELARQIQMSVLPEAPPVCVGYELAACIETARAVGGDFYDFIPLPHQRYGVVIGDVTDKGMPAAIFMAQTYALLHAEASRNALPQRALSRVNRHLMRMNARGLFATILYGILDTHAHRFTYSRAGHELPILYMPDGKVSLLPKKDGQPVGILDDPVFDQHTISLPPGSSLLLYTDGASDQSNPEGQPFGLERLIQTFSQLARQRPAQICQGLVETLEAHRGPASRFDDVTLVAIRAED